MHNGNSFVLLEKNRSYAVHHYTHVPSNKIGPWMDLSPVILFSREVLYSMTGGLDAV